MSHPPFCPTSTCPHHREDTGSTTRWWFKNGHYRCTRIGVVQRYRCKTCGTYFSDASFSIDYYAKRRVDYHSLIDLITNGVGMRATARVLGVSVSAVACRIMRLCRYALSVHADLQRHMVLHEDLVADGFQSFWVSQYHPNNINLLVGAQSQYVYAVTAATLKRNGRMTAFQKRRRDQIEAQDPSDPRELRRRFTELLERAGRMWRNTTHRVLRTDKHQAYPCCLRDLSIPGVRHIRISSRKARTVTNPLFAVNYLDREIRKDLAEHRRETACHARSAVMSIFSLCEKCSMARMWVYVVKHNCMKPYRMSPRHSQTHAEVAGVPSGALMRATRYWLKHRVFLSRSPLDHEHRRIWMGMVHTPGGGYATNHRLVPRYAFV